MNALETLHSAGYVHLDIKMENIVRVKREPGFSLKLTQNEQYCLIDYGISKAYVDDQGRHVKESQNNGFRGNLLFSSPNAFNNKGILCVTFRRAVEERRYNLRCVPPNISLIRKPAMVGGPKQSFPLERDKTDENHSL